MFRRTRLVALVSATVLAIAAFSTESLAAPKDDAARKLDKNAMDNDFLMADFPKAQATLEKAVATCGDSGCSPSVKAQILVHLGIVQFNMGDVASAEESFSRAIAAFPRVVPDADYMTADIQKLFDQSKATAGGSGSSQAEPADSSGSDEIDHEPVQEQMVNTPVPIWVSVPDDMGAERVFVRYRPFGGDWKKLDLRKMRGGFGGLVNCNEVTTTGALKYHITVLDKSGDVIATLGTATKPFEVKITNQLDGDPPSLPNEPPPARCAAKEDCPPGLPGCPTGGKGVGEECEVDRDCEKGLVCSDEVCEEAPDAGPSKKNWVSLGVSIDFALLSGKDVCGTESQKSKGFACFTKDDYPIPGMDAVMQAGSHYHGLPAASGYGNAIDGGLGPSTLRILAGYDRLLIDNLTVGARVGLALLGGPKPDGGKSFLPLHLEARAAYWIGSAPFSRAGFRPFVFLNGGMAQVDTKVDVWVTEDDQFCAAAPCSYEIRNTGEYLYYPKKQEVEAWRKAGQGFFGGGLGLMYAIAPNHGPVLELKVSYMLPTTNLVFSPTLGYAFGF